MATKPKGRYKSREEIVAEIDKYLRLVGSFRKRAEMLYTSADLMRLESRKKKSEGVRQRLILGANSAEEDGDRNIEYAARLKGGKLKQLQDKLSEFDTETLPGMTDDKSVEAL